MGLAGWLMVIKRMRSDGLIVTAAIVTILLAVVLLAAGPIYADAVTVAGAQRTLVDAPVVDVNVSISQRMSGDEFSVSDAQVASQAERFLSPTGGEIVRLGRSEPYRLPDEVIDRLAANIDPDDDRTRQTVITFFDGLEDHATIVDGRWPVPTAGDDIEAVLPEPAASLLGIDVGAVLPVTNRVDANLTLTVQIVGFYRPNDRDDPYWYQEALPVDGLDSGESVVVIGPLVTDQASFTEQVMARLSTIEWRLFPAFDQLSVADVEPMRVALQRMPDRLELDQETGTPFQIRSGLAPLLADIDQGLLAARSGVFILTLQLAILAGYALVLTANLLADVRSVEMGLLRSRGAGVWQIAGFSLLEGLLLIGPAVAAGPWLAAWALRLLNVAGPLAAIDLTLNPQVSRLSYLFAGLAGLGCLLVLTIPSLLAARSILSARASRGREGDAPLWQRAGADLALVAIAGLGFVQLRRFGSPLTETVRGRLELDPLLVAAPALALIAGAVLALRLVPLIGRIAERLTSRSNRLVSALGSWQLSRRPGRYARSALLLMLALGIGLFAVSFSRTWNGSQADQADHQVGADIVVLPDRTDASVAEEYLGGAYRQMTGVVAAMPVSSGFINIPGTDDSGRVMVLDAEHAPEIVSVRDDFAGTSLDELLAPLADGRPEIAGIDVPGEPRWIALDIQSTMSRICTDPVLVPDAVGAPGVHVYESFQCEEHETLTPRELQQFDEPLTPSIVIQDRNGRFYRLAASPLLSSQETQRVLFDTHNRVDGDDFPPVFPVQIVEIELATFQAPTTLSRQGTFRLLDVLGSEDENPTNWVSAWDESLNPEWEFSPELTASEEFTSVPAVKYPLAIQPSILDLELNPGVNSVSTFGGFNQPQVEPRTRFEFSIRFRQAGEGRSIPVIASERLLIEIAFGSTSNARLRLLLGGENRQVTIVGTLRSFPTIDPDVDVIILVDGPTIDAIQFIETGRIDSSFDSWWLGTGSNATDGLAAVLDQPPFNSNNIITRTDRTQALRTDPVALGTLGALSLGFVAAVVFAVIGFVSSAAVGARERLTEFALLRAIGLSSRQLAGWLLLENGALVVVSLLGGTALGFLLSWLILPLITVNRDAAQVFPSLVVIIPWRTMLMVEAVILLILLIVSGLMALVLRRVGLGTALRVGEE